MKINKQTITRCLCLILAGFCLSSCGADSDEAFTFSGPDKGGLRLQLPALDPSEPIVISKAADFTLIDPADFVIEIYKKGEDNYYKRFETFTDMQAEGTPLELPVGEYTVKAFSCDPDPVMDMPYFCGSTDLRIEAHSISQATVECRYESLGVEIILTDAFRNFFADIYQITVEQDTGISAVLIKHSPSRIYFTNDCLYLKVTIECTPKNGDASTARVYYFNREGEDPDFNGDGPFKGEYFMITIDTEKIVGKSL
ncbi:DUF4493 domain-containing protein [Parabacteroides sp. PF5-6]|uniref:DUF4493 domain-containing protein n=1 Tax=Parabacteroides sp. PF5-6 TaxID=1742403 RepID=UPI002404CA35|nr:DUF4493 domain-containing protein [Parabacteroides sp. PF5-6]MDF9831116.1 hypothetical protein [Parabacteroides sp. PF5-6]